MCRTAIEQLIEWKDSWCRKPLIVEGARQVGKTWLKNRKFIYGLVKQGARAREYEIALQWLMDGGLIHRVNSVKAPRMPLRSQVEPIVFR